MYKVSVKFPNKKRVSVFTGVVGFQAGTGAIDITFYDNTALLIQLVPGAEVFRSQQTDEEILNGDNKEYAAWFKAKKEAFEAKQAEEEAAKSKAGVAE